MRDIHDRPMVVVFKSRPTRPKQTKPKGKDTGKSCQNTFSTCSTFGMLWQLTYILESGNAQDSIRPLVFVDVSNSNGTGDIDQHRKKEIRTHVMRDYWRREKRKFLARDHNSTQQNAKASTQLTDEDKSLRNSTIPRIQYKGMDPFVQYPVQMHSNMYRLLHYCTYTKLNLCPNID